jgi:uncharacterized membrane protein (UPF0127 family)
VTRIGQWEAVAVAGLFIIAAYGAVAGGIVAPLGDDSGTASTATPTPTSDSATVHSDYETTAVTVVDSDTDEELGAVTAAIADNSSLRYTGLSETDDLPEERGMLFTYGSERNLTYVMREMSFAIDIVYIAENGTITSIHHAPEPGPDEDGESQRYSGRGQYVLEVNYNWTTDRGVDVGDRVQFDL